MEQAVSKTSWLWPYCCRKGAEWPDIQQYKLLVKKGSRATWYTTMQTTSEGREQSDLTHNSANYQWKKRAEWPDIQYFLLWHRLLLEESKATWWTTLSAAVQTVVGREQSNLMNNTICSCADRCWKRAKWFDRQHCSLSHRLL